MTACQEPGPPEANKIRTRNEVPDQVDVALVGCGLGGLTAAAFLARAGLRVACFDGHYVAGGSATVFSRGARDTRYHFDVGVHYLGDCGPDGAIPRILGELAVEVDFVPLDQDGFDTFVFPDFTFRVPADRHLYRDRLVELFPRERRGIDRYLAFLDEVDRIGGMVERNHGRLSPRIALEAVLRGRKLVRWQNATLGAFLDTCTSDPKLRAILTGQHGDYGLPPSKVSALLHAGLANHYFKGAYYPRCGGQVIADRLAAVIEARGGTVHLRRPIDRILVEGGRAVGVRVAGKRGEHQDVRARAVLSNADIRRTLLELVGPEHLPSGLATKASHWEMGGALFITFLGLQTDMRARGMKATNYWVFDGYDTEELYRRLATEPPDGRVAYITSATMKDPSSPHHAPAGVTNVEVMSLVPSRFEAWGVSEAEALSWGYKRSERYAEIKERVADELIAHLDRLFPGSTEHLVYRECATPVTHTRYTRASGGTSYGLACTPEQFMQGRPGYRAAVPGLYLCGASTRAGHGIVGVMLGGQAAARTVLKDHGGSHARAA